MANENEIDDGLTDEERAALADDDGGGTDTNTDTDAERAAEAAAAAEADKAKLDAEAAAAAANDPSAAEAAAAAAATAANEAAEATEAQTKSAPILIAPPPEDAAAKLAEIETKKEALLNQFDDGDITMREYQKQVADLDKDVRAIERSQDRAELATQMEQQRLENDWKATCNTFVANNAIYKDRPELYTELDSEVRFLASKPETANWTGQKFLDEAHKRITLIHGIAKAETKVDERSQRQQRDLPPNLAKVPAADVQDTNGGRFAVLDRLANSDPIAYEETLNTMSQAERDAYMAIG